MSIHAKEFLKKPGTIKLMYQKVEKVMKLTFCEPE